MLLKLITEKNVYFATISILVMNSNLKTPFVMALLLSLLKVLITLVLLMTLENLMQFICWKILCLMIVGIKSTTIILRV